MTVDNHQHSEALRRAEQRVASIEQEGADYARRAETIGTRTATWILAANAGALLLCLNAVLDHKVCDWLALRPLVVIFTLGLAVTYLSIALEHLWAATLASLLREARDLAKQFSQLYNEAFAQRGTSLDSHKAKEFFPRFDSLDRNIDGQIDGLQRAKRIWLLSDMLRLFGTAAFGTGLIVGLFGTELPAALCTPP